MYHTQNRGKKPRNYIKLYMTKHKEHLKYFHNKKEISTNKINIINNINITLSQTLPAAVAGTLSLLKWSF